MSQIETWRHVNFPHPWWLGCSFTWMTNTFQNFVSASVCKLTYTKPINLYIYNYIPVHSQYHINVLCWNLLLYLPHPHQCSGYHCPPCHQDTAHTLYPEVSPYTSLLGGRGWAHRRDEAASLPSLRKEKVNNPLFQQGGRLASTNIETFLLCQGLLGLGGGIRSAKCHCFHSTELLFCTGFCGPESLPIETCIVQLLDSPHASHSITVFFRNTISLIWKTMNQIMTFIFVWPCQNECNQLPAHHDSCSALQIYRIRYVYAVLAVWMFAFLTCCFRSSLISASARFVILIWLIISPSEKIKINTNSPKSNLL